MTGDRNAELACPGCTSFGYSFAWRYHSYSILKCDKCTLQFTYPLIAGSASYYKSHYGGVVEDVRAYNIPSSYLYLAETIRDASRRYLASSQRKVLDVGCGPGYLLLELRDRGFDCYGIDFNSEVVSAAKQRFGLNIEVQTLEGLTKLNSRFDLVLLSHVLEHVAAPLQLLREIKDVMSPDGILVIEVPDPEYCRFRSALYRGKLAWGNYPPHHLTFWSPKALGIALLAAGYKVLTCQSRPYPERLQTRHTFVHERGWPDNSVTTAITCIFEILGRAMKLRGATLNAVAKPLPGVSDGN